MDRRGFLKRMSAAAAAFTAAVSGRVAAAAGGDSVPAAAGPSLPRSGRDLAAAVRTKSKTPCVSITADTSRFEKAIGEAGKQVVELLRECRVTSSEWCSAVGEVRRYRVTFEKCSPAASRTALDDEAWQIIERGHLTSVSVSSESEPCDVVMLGGYRPIDLHGMTKLSHTVTAEFIV